MQLIRNNVEKIHQTAATLESHAKISKVIRNKILKRVEKMLIVSMQDLIRKRVSLSTATIQESSLTCFENLHRDSASNDSFSARKWWFEKFKSRFNFKNL